MCRLVMHVVIEMSYSPSFCRLNSSTSLSQAFLKHGMVSYLYRTLFVMTVIEGRFSFSDYCPIPLPMEYLKSNYTYWKSQIPDSPSNSASEDDVSDKLELIEQYPTRCAASKQCVLCLWAYA